MQSLNQAHLICMELVHLIRWTTQYLPLIFKQIILKALSIVNELTMLF